MDARAIIDKIQKDAQADASRILAEARKKADKLRFIRFFYGIQAKAAIKISSSLKSPTGEMKPSNLRF